MVSTLTVAYKAVGHSMKVWKGGHMKVAGLFAGIGGFELAALEVGCRPALLADIDPAAQKVLRSNFAQGTVLGDVVGITGIPDDIDIITAGFPCQNLSMAGDKSGINGNKSNVVSHLFRILARSKAHTILIENVYFMLHLDRGRAMDWLIGQIEALNSVGRIGFWTPTVSGCRTGGAESISCCQPPH